MCTVTGSTHAGRVPVVGHKWGRSPVAPAALVPKMEVTFVMRLQPDLSYLLRKTPSVLLRLRRDWSSWAASLRPGREFIVLRLRLLICNRYGHLPTAWLSGNEVHTLPSTARGAYQAH